MTQENLNNLENNEIPKTTPEKVEEKEISQEEFLNWLDNEGNMFKNEIRFCLFTKICVGSEVV